MKKEKCMKITLEDIFNDLEIEKVNLLIGVPYVELKTTTIK